MERVSAELKECHKTAKKWHLEAEAVRKTHVDEQREFLAVVRSVQPVLPVGGAVPAVAVGVSEVSSAGGMSSPPGSPMKVGGSGAEGEVTEVSSFSFCFVVMQNVIFGCDST